MRSELFDPGPRWEAARRYLGLPETASHLALEEIVLAMVEKLQQIEARLDAESGGPGAERLA